MAKETTENSNQLNLTVVALVALVAIVGLVALVMNATPKTFATGSKVVNAAAQTPSKTPAEAQNTAGQVYSDCRLITTATPWQAGCYQNCWYCGGQLLGPEYCTDPYCKVNGQWVD